MQKRRTPFATGKFSGVKSPSAPFYGGFMSDKLIDVHSHPLLPIWLEALGRATGKTSEAITISGAPVPPWSTERHLDALDGHGISASILSLPDATDFLKGREARALARTINEQLAEIVARHPSRFGAFAVVPLDDMDAAIEEMTYALDVLRLDGVASSTHADGVYLGDSYFDRWFEEMNRRSVTLFVHPVPPPHFELGRIGLNVAILEFMFDSTRMVANMVMSGAKARFRDVAIISTHGGGAIPYLAPRISVLEPLFGAGENRQTLSGEEVLTGLSSFYYDLTASTAPASIDAIRRLVPASQILMGFDFPMMPASTIASAQEQFATYEGMQRDEKRMILAGNALRLFPRLAGQ
jgi:6-methylsalicylate decarboxylase